MYWILAELPSPVFWPYNIVHLWQQVYIWEHFYSKFPELLITGTYHKLLRINNHHLSNLQTIKRDRTDPTDPLLVHTHFAHN